MSGAKIQEELAVNIRCAFEKLIPKEILLDNFRAQYMTVEVDWGKVAEAILERDKQTDKKWIDALAAEVEKWREIAKTLVDGYQLEHGANGAKARESARVRQECADAITRIIGGKQL